LEQAGLRQQVAAVQPSHHSPHPAVEVVQATDHLALAAAAGAAVTTAPTVLAPARQIKATQVERARPPVVATVLAEVAGQAP
jgi:hypothetical protein